METQYVRNIDKKYMREIKCILRPKIMKSTALSKIPNFIRQLSKTAYRIFSATPNDSVAIIYLLSLLSVAKLCGW